MRSREEVLAQINEGLRDFVSTDCGSSEVIATRDLTVRLERHKSGPLDDSISLTIILVEGGDLISGSVAVVRFWEDRALVDSSDVKTSNRSSLEAWVNLRHAVRFAPYQIELLDKPQKK